MSNEKKQVRFALSQSGNPRLVARPRLTSERGLETVNLGIWLGLATLLWFLIMLAFI